MYTFQRHGYRSSQDDCMCNYNPLYRVEHPQPPQSILPLYQPPQAEFQTLWMLRTREAPKLITRGKAHSSSGQGRTLGICCRDSDGWDQRVAGRGQRGQGWEQGSTVLVVLFSGLQVDWMTLKASYTGAERLLFKPIIRKASLPLVLSSLKERLEEPGYQALRSCS